jgi:hypothetical protein
MSLFQNAVITKHLNTQDKNKLVQQWASYQIHFLNSTIQENIRNSKGNNIKKVFCVTYL